MMEDPHECEVCGKDCEELTARGANNGNKDTRFMCDECFEEVFNEQP